MKQKQLDIELMRIFAAFFVIFNHTGTAGFFRFSIHDMNSARFWAGLAVSVFCKFSVPLFFMISGALLLNRPAEPLKKLWSRRVLHMGFLLVFWSFFYYLASVHKDGGSVNIKWFLTKAYDSNWNAALWYLYAYIPLLISLPLLQRIAQSLSNREYLYLFSLYGFFGMVLPSVQYLIWQDRHRLNFNISWICANIFIFPLAGYLLQHRAKAFWNLKRVLLLWILNLSTIFLSCYLTYLRAVVMGVCDEGHSQAFHMTFVIINSTAIFVTAQYLNEHTNLLKRFQKPISSIGGCTFGIYLLHVYIKDYTALAPYLWHPALHQLHLPRILYTMVFCGVVFFIGYLVTLVLKKIPVLKKLVS